jgi:hypothetical protein
MVVWFNRTANRCSGGLLLAGLRGIALRPRIPAQAASLALWAGTYQRVWELKAP